MVIQTTIEVGGGGGESEFEGERIQPVFPARRGRNERLITPAWLWSYTRDHFFI